MAGPASIGYETGARLHRVRVGHDGGRLGGLGLPRGSLGCTACERAAPPRRRKRGCRDCSSWSAAAGGRVWCGSTCLRRQGRWAVGQGGLAAVGGGLGACGPADGPAISGQCMAASVARLSWAATLWQTGHGCTRQSSWPRAQDGRSARPGARGPGAQAGAAAPRQRHDGIVARHAALARPYRGQPARGRQLGAYPGWCVLLAVICWRPRVLGWRRWTGLTSFHQAGPATLHQQV